MNKLEFKTKFNIGKSFDDIENKLKECYMDSFFNPAISTYKYVVYLNLEENKLFITDPIDEQKFLYDYKEFGSHFLKLYSLSAYTRKELKLVNKNVIEKLTEDEQKELFEYLKKRDWRTKGLEKRANENKEEFNLYYCLINCQELVELRFKELFEDRYFDEIIKYLEANWIILKKEIKQEVIKTFNLKKRGFKNE